ncbi:hypothetical protein P691DRAFT_813147 [Macrolepiota fuliginosa MF-IS2]|uniref:Uncharacterized protein n=1 Tax=Macrolepiota fuliginosa MF-IS2 TaxID=1400762 RepID=A0A9P6C4T7_9AGAR|nr:hypothetical protein P691DRAFT_813147 [Macrolepiota fuliginosa MF-IS2]
MEATPGTSLASAAMTSLGNHASRGRSRRRIANSRRPVSMPLFLRDLSSHSPPKMPLEPFVKFAGVSHQDQERAVEVGSTLPLAFTAFIVLGIIVAHAMGGSCFDATRACAAVMSSIFFLPFVRPVRWLTRIVLKVSLWSTLHILVFLIGVSRSTFRLAAGLANGVKHHSQHGMGISWRSFLVRTLAGSFAAYILSSEIPLSRFASIGSRLVRFVFKILRAFVLLQYYMILLASLEFLIYLRVDCVMAVIGAPWFRWVVYRVWSMLTWVDIVVRSFPLYYVLVV